jgi:JAB domain-containing protein similar to deubiquitination enzymes
MLWSLIFLVAGTLPVTDELAMDPVVHARFVELLRQGGYGWFKTERAAFIIREANGDYRFVAWPFTHKDLEAYYRGTIPDGLVAIVHTHPNTAKQPSPGDCETARRLAISVFVLTANNIYVATSCGEIVAVVTDSSWAR